MNKNINKGKIKIFYGPMFSGKTSKIISDIKKHDNENILVFKPKQDIRTSGIFSRDGSSYPAIVIENSNEIFNYNFKKIKNIFIDEINFFDENLIKNINKIINKGINVILSGLDTNYRAEYFEHVKKLIELADEKVKLKGICHECNNESEYTSRYKNGKPDLLDSPVNISDTIDKNDIEYRSSCKEHHPFIKNKN